MTQNIGKHIQFIDNNKVLVGIICGIIDNAYYVLVNIDEYLIPAHFNVIIF